MLAFFIFYKVKYMKFDELIEMETTADCGVAMPTNRFDEVTKTIKKKLKKKKIMRMNPLMREDVNLMKFKYTNYKHDPKPQVMALDYHYEGKPNEKNKTDHLLGWNVNGYENKEEAKNSIRDILTFAKMLSADNKEKYKRIKYFFPEQAELIRRYKKEHIKNLKEKDGWFWKKTSLDTLENKDKEL